MWDMFNSFKVNPNRVFSIIPFVGVGYTYCWDYNTVATNVAPYVDRSKSDNPRVNQSLLPVSAGLQLRFRCGKYVDIFAEGRAQFYGDNFNNVVHGQPIEAMITAVGGIAINIGGSGFRSYNPCDYLSYINNLNNQVNDLRGELAATGAALAAAEAQLPCPEVTAAPVAVSTPMLSTVRFKINSAEIEPFEEVYVYNVAQYLKAIPTPPSPSPDMLTKTPAPPSTTSASHAAAPKQSATSSSTITASTPTASPSLPKAAQSSPILTTTTGTALSSSPTNKH